VKSLTLSVALLIALCAGQACAADVTGVAGRPLSIAELNALVVAPRIYSVVAYVVEKHDECPPCPPNAVCETCVYGIYLADHDRARAPGAAMGDGIYLSTNKAREFQLGARYLFRIRYRLEKNAAGAWRQTGPELIDFTRVGPADRPQ